MTNGRIKTTEESSFRKAVNILLPFFIYFAVHDLAQILLAFLANMSMGVFGGGYAEWMMGNAATVNGLLNALSLTAGMAAVWPMAGRELKWARILGRKETEAGKRTAGEAVGYVCLGIFAASFAMGVNIWMALAGLTGISERYQEVADRQYGVALGIGILIYGLISPLAEEIVFRGLIYNRMRRYFGKILSVTVCGVMFGLYHGNLVQGIYGTILGIAITYSYEWYGSFFAPVLFHAAANIAVFIAGYGKAVKGNLVTPFNCGIFMTIAVLDLFVIWKTGKKK